MATCPGLVLSPISCGHDYREIVAIPAVPTRHARLCSLGRKYRPPHSRSACAPLRWVSAGKSAAVADMFRGTHLRGAYVVTDDLSRWGRVEARPPYGLPTAAGNTATIGRPPVAVALYAVPRSCGRMEALGCGGWSVVIARYGRKIAASRSLSRPGDGARGSGIPPPPPLAPPYAFYTSPITPSDPGVTLG